MAAARNPKVIMKTRREPVIVEMKRRDEFIVEPFVESQDVRIAPVNSFLFPTVESAS